jgi:DNA-binding response OmpR family regulator
VEALGALREHRPDVAVLDHLMPGMDGVQVAARARDEHLGTVVVLLSAALDGVSMVDLRRAGVTAWLEKGIAPRQFGDAIRGAVARAAPAVTSP